MSQSEAFSIRVVRSILTRIGATLSKKRLDWLDYWVERAMSQLIASNWLRAQGFPFKPRYRDRKQLYTALARSIGSLRILYLEFGVFQGSSMRIWSKLLTNPGSSLHGFDSFEGLPEHWNTVNPSGTFYTKDNLPRFDDPRVHLHVGWFNQTLPQFSLPSHERLIVHVDADLYSSTRYVLEVLQPHITVGTVVLFDEFYDRQHELKAFDEFLRSSQMKFRFLGSATSLSQVAFERIA
jgi:hypothetical protein